MRTHRKRLAAWGLEYSVLLPAGAMAMGLLMGRMAAGAEDMGNEAMERGWTSSAGRFGERAVLQGQLKRNKWSRHRR